MSGRQAARRRQHTVDAVRKQRNEMGKKILVIDDEPINLRMASYVLSEKSYEVMEAESGAEGLALLREGEVDLVLLDIEMPGMNGIETLERIRREGFGVPVIFLTASGDRKDVMEAVKLGAADYVIKPFMPSDLLGRVAKALG